MLGTGSNIYLTVSECSLFLSFSTSWRPPFIILPWQCEVEEEYLYRDISISLNMAHLPLWPFERWTCYKIPSLKLSINATGSVG